MVETIIQDIGENVCCDMCNEDYTNSDESGGFMFSGYAYCPKCAVERLPRIKGYGEEHFITDWCPKDKSFKDWILEDIRKGDNTIKIIKNEPLTYETTDIYISSVLATLGFPIEIEQKPYARNQMFVITVKDANELAEIQRTVNAYWQHEITVDPCELFSQYKTLRGKVLGK